jgi:hypothetical protein
MVNNALAALQSTQTTGYRSARSLTLAMIFVDSKDGSTADWWGSMKKQKFTSETIQDR